MISETTLGNQSRSKSSGTVPAHTASPLGVPPLLPQTINIRNPTSRQHKMNAVIDAWREQIMAHERDATALRGGDARPRWSSFQTRRTSPTPDRRSSCQVPVGRRDRRKRSRGRSASFSPGAASKRLPVHRQPDNARP